MKLNILNLIYSTLVLSVLLSIGHFATYIPIHHSYWISWLAATFWTIQVTFDYSNEFGYDIMGLLIDKI